MQTKFFNYIVCLLLSFISFGCRKTVEQKAPNLTTDQQNVLNIFLQKKAMYDSSEWKKQEMLVKNLRDELVSKMNIAKSKDDSIMAWRNYKTEVVKILPRQNSNIVTESEYWDDVGNWIYPTNERELMIIGVTEDGLIHIKEKWTVVRNILWAWRLFGEYEYYVKPLGEFRYDLIDPKHLDDYLSGFALGLEWRRTEGSCLIDLYSSYAPPYDIYNSCFIDYVKGNLVTTIGYPLIYQNIDRNEHGGY